MLEQVVGASQYLAGCLAGYLAGYLVAGHLTGYLAGYLAGCLAGRVEVQVEYLPFGDIHWAVNVGQGNIETSGWS